MCQHSSRSCSVAVEQQTVKGVQHRARPCQHSLVQGLAHLALELATEVLLQIDCRPATDLLPVQVSCWVAV